jgi:hypothetical protein
MRRSKRKAFSGQTRMQTSPQSSSRFIIDDEDKSALAESISSAPSFPRAEEDGDPGKSIVISPPQDEKLTGPGITPPTQRPAKDTEHQLELPARSSTRDAVLGARLANPRRGHSLAVIGTMVLGLNLFTFGILAVWFSYSISSGSLNKAAGASPPVQKAIPLAEVSAEDLGRTEDRLLTRLIDIQDQLQSTKKRLDESEEQSRKNAATLALNSAQNSGQTPDGKLASLISDLQTQLQALQKRIADDETSMAQSNSRMKDLIVAVSAAGAQKEPAAAAPSTIPGGADTSAQSLTPTESELLLLKERNRLTAYADEAIVTGAREPYVRLWESLEDPRMKNLLHAARAEILRVQTAYLAGSRIDRYDIPVAELFPESAALRDTQLSDDQIIQLLQDQKQPWQTRVKSAWILGQRRNNKAGEALVNAIKNDPNLDVVKEATFSFEQLTGFHSKIFETALLEAWWKEYNTVPISGKAKGVATQKAPPAASDAEAEKKAGEQELVTSGKP